jgi:acyl-CoA synthetase (AMP-forming)/AMP-acid ligase II
MSTNMGQLITRRARRDPGLEALYDVAKGERFTYAELNERSNRVAHSLAADGITHGDRVALLLGNGVEFLDSFFGAAKLGAVTVPLNTRLVADEYEFILSDAGAETLIFDEEFTEVVAELRGRGTKTAVRRWVQVGGSPPEGVVSFADWVASADRSEPDIAIEGGDLLFVMYTSGTTGLPKGVMHSHETIAAMLMTVTGSGDWRYTDRFLNALPLFHVGALSPVLCQIFLGASVILQRAFDPVQSWDLIRDERITTTLLVPAMLQFMLATHQPDSHDVSSLRSVFSGAAPVAVPLINACTDLGVEIHQVYGLTESAGTVCLISPTDAVDHVGSTGRAFFFTDVRVIDDNGNDCDPGQPGEVIARGDHVMVGYWNRPDATAEAIVDGWLHTGDVATIDEEGFVTIVDRVKDMLISGGENVYPAEIESVLMSHDEIADVGVIGIPSARWGESPLAVVVKASASLTADAVIEHCQGRLASFKTVKAVEFVDVIPRNASGKILKRELRVRFDYPAAD